MKPIPIQASPPRHVTAARDEHGVPHVHGKTWLDALFGLGYVHALDRATQLLFARTMASGRAAEKISDSPELLETDRFFRRAGLYRDLRFEVGSLDVNTHDQLAVYCEGVNAGLAAVGWTWPILATRFTHEPWDEEGVLLIGQMLSFAGLAISQMQNERIILELVHAGVDDDLMRELFSPRLDEADFDMIRQVKFKRQLSDEALELLTDLPRLAGSNAWAVSPQRSETGGALLASDPHLEINRLPAIWYEAVLRYGDRYVMGASLPGCPLFAVGRTESLAWGVTYMRGDTVDYFVEDVRRGGEVGWQYRRGENWRDFKLREEAILRRGGELETLRVYENSVGTLEGDPDQIGAGRQLSVAWAGSRSGAARIMQTWLEMIAAGSAAQGMDIAREGTHPTLCWVFADRAGHIGLQASGRFPIRGGGHNGLSPIPAWDVGNHWQGWVNKRLLPRSYDPPEGFVSTANEEMNPAGGLLLVTQPLHDYRKRRIDERLAEMPAASIGDMQQLQYDLVSVQARDVLDVLLPLMPEGPVKERMTSWDRGYEPHSVDASLFFRLYRNVMVQLFGHERGIGWRRMLHLSSRAGYSSMMTAVMDRLLAREDSAWYEGRDKRKLIEAAVEKLAGEPDVPWKDVNYFHFADRFFGQHQVGRLLGFASRRYPMPGCPATIFQGHVMQTASREATFAPSYHFVADLSTDEAWTNIPGGPSESRFSRYYNNDVPRWLAGEYKRLSVGDVG